MNANEDFFTRQITCDFTGDNIFNGLQVPSGLLQSSFTDGADLYLHGITLSSSLRFVTQSVNGVWVVFGHQEPTLYLGGCTDVIASHTVVAAQAFTDQAWSRSTWITFPRILLMAGMPISLYANGLNNFFGSTTKAVAQCSLQLTRA